MSDTLAPLQPYDVHNRRLEANVHPSDWQNPKPSGRYNLVVIGAGTAGLVTAAGAAGLGAKVALVERELMGGDCLNVGCVPSKAMIAAGRQARTLRRADQFGIDVDGDIRIDFGRVMERMRALRADMSPVDSAARFRDLGVDVFLGSGKFVTDHKIVVGDHTLEYKRAVIATGARAAAPPIDGLDSVHYFTNETVFSLTELPKRIGIIGAGPIGCELAQTFAQLGSETFLVETSHGILSKEDSDASTIVESSMKSDGVRLLCCGRELKVEKSGEQIRLQVDSHGTPYDQIVDQLLVAVGRAPNIENLGLDDVGVQYDQHSIQINDRFQTTNRTIFAAGDVCSNYKFTHAADFMARAVIQNALFLGRSKESSLTIPWCTYTTPEIARVGLSASEASDRGVAIDTYEQPMAEVDRAMLAGDTEGFVRIHTKKGSDEIVGATIVADNAGDLIAEVTLAMTHGLGLKKIASTIHPYPTTADAIRRIGDQFNRTRLTPFVASMMQRWLAWQR